MKYSAIGNYYVNYQNYQNSVLLTTSDTDASILAYKFRLERTGFNMYSEYTQQQLTFLALHSCEDLGLECTRLKV